MAGTAKRRMASCSPRVYVRSGVTFSLAKASRYTRTLRFAVLLACAAFLLGNFAHASHVHTKSGQNEVTCQFCQHFERAAPPPSPSALRAPSIVLTTAPHFEDAIVCVVERAYGYFARGPPQV